MDFFENCLERATALAATCGWLAFGGGGAEAVVGVAIGGAGIAAVLSDTFSRNGPESEAALRAIRRQIAVDLHALAEAERWDTRADVEAADAALERTLSGCFLDRRALASSARSQAGFPAAATDLILERLAEREPATFGREAPITAVAYARLVIRTALEAAVENEAYFRKLQPHLMMEALRGIGAVDERVVAVHADVTKILEIVSRERAPPISLAEVDEIKVELLVNARGELTILHDRKFPYAVRRVECNLDDGTLNFVVDGGFKKDFGIPLAPELRQYLREDCREVLMIHMDETTGEPLEGGYLPLSCWRP